MSNNTFTSTCGSFADTLGGGDVQIDADAMRSLVELPRATVPKGLENVVPSTTHVLFGRIVTRETSKMGSVRRVLLVTRQHLYLACLDGDVKRMIIVTSIREIVHGQQKGEQQVLLRVPEQDMILTFVKDKKNPASATLEHLVGLLQLISKAWKGTNIPETHTTSNLRDQATNLDPTPESAAKLKMPQKRVEAFLSTSRTHAPPPVATPEIQQQMVEVNALNDALDKLKMDIQKETEERDRLQAEHDALGEEIAQLRAAEGVAAPPVAMGIEYAQTNAQAEALIAAADDLHRENDELCAQVEHYRRLVAEAKGSVGEAAGALGREIEELKRQIRVERAEQEKAAVGIRAHRVLSLMVASICAERRQRLMLQQEESYDTMLRSKRTSLDLAQKKVDELQFALHRMASPTRSKQPDVVQSPTRGRASVSASSQPTTTSPMSALRRAPPQQQRTPIKTPLHLL